MPRKKRGDPPKPFETANEKAGFIRIYKDLFLSDSYGGLSQEAKELFLSMLCSRYHQGNIDKAELAEKYGNEDRSYFYFNTDKWKKSAHKRDYYHYNLFSNWKQFSKYRDELIEAGLIDLVEANGHRMTKNVYRFSVRWKNKGVFK